jgi:hypothetical protein
MSAPSPAPAKPPKKETPKQRIARRLHFNDSNMKKLDALVAKADSLSRRADAVRFVNRNYGNTWNKSAKGISAWAFEFLDGAGKVMATEFAPGSKTLKDAKNWAMQRAKEIGSEVVSIAP